MDGNTILTPLQKSNDDYHYYITKNEGLVFLHLNVTNWSPSVFREIRKDFKGLTETLYADGYDLAFVCSKAEKSVKMWRMLHPLMELHPLGNKGFLGAWDLEEMYNGN